MKQILKAFCKSPKKFLLTFIQRYPLLDVIYQKTKSYFDDIQVNRCLSKKADIFVYISDDLKSLNEIQEWISIFENLNKEKALIVVTRNKNIAKYIRKTFDLEVYCAVTLNKLLLFYERLSPKIIFYINNGYKNFQSLIYNDAIHIYLSNPHNDCNNQAKAYDFVYISGKYELDKYLDTLIRIDDDRFVQVGRPVLDLVQPLELDTKGKKVILYVSDFNLYDNDLDYVENVVNNMLNMNKYFLIYMPFNVEVDNEVLNLKHEKIIQKISNSENSTVLLDTNYNKVYPIVDLAIFDTFDYDYLFVDKPYLMTDITDKSYHANRLEIINKSNILLESNIEKSIMDEIDNDSMKDNRKELRKYYMNDYQKGKSFDIFKGMVQKGIVFRDQEVKNKAGEL